MASLMASLLSQELQPYSALAWPSSWKRSDFEGSSLWNTAKQEKGSSLMFVGICLAVVVLIAALMLWLWTADRMKRRRSDPLRKSNLESRTAASQYCSFAVRDISQNEYDEQET
ncbi:hypothetical protein EJ02DRAFT_453939 [Clathrospora elynae]|uniref:Uncharacterized protein n=1 Tax=Clathrospora elynae TaxID=706981 RepID=A0A6A5SSY3_9PLEO|nr:hypothetical protein EJ02DRAFT_453939 [Clathrospora elynae]